MARALRSRRRFACGGLLLLLAACSRPAQQAETPPPAPPPKTIPAPPPPLGRAELIAAAEAVAASAAAGEAYPAAASALSGRRFSLRLPFGCSGPSPADAPVRYRYDAERGTLQLSAAPEIWTDAEWARALAGVGNVEAIEGFWIRRPWLRTENCPVVPPPPADAAAPAGENVAGEAETQQAEAPPVALPPSPETLGVARVFEAGGSRLLRRGGRPYEVTRRTEPAEAPGPQGFRLVLQGRLSAASDPIRCRSDSPDRRPICLLLVEFDRVAFEDPAGKTLAEWRA